MAPQRFSLSAVFIACSRQSSWRPRESTSHSPMASDCWLHCDCGRCVLHYSSQVTSASQPSRRCFCSGWSLRSRGPWCGAFAGLAAVTLL